MVYRVAAIVFRQVGRPHLALDANIRAANLGDRLAIYELSQMYSLGIGVERDPDEAVKWLTKAAESGHVAAMDQMAEDARATYRNFVYESEGFLDYWQSATPINEISRLQIGSRPAKRRKGGFEAIRAIP